MAQIQSQVDMLKATLNITTWKDVWSQMDCPTDPATTLRNEPCAWSFDPVRNPNQADFYRRRAAQIHQLLQQLSQMTAHQIESREGQQQLRRLADIGLCIHHRKYATDVFQRWALNIRNPARTAWSGSSGELSQSSWQSNSRGTINSSVAELQAHSDNLEVKHEHPTITIQQTMDENEDLRQRIQALEERSRQPRKKHWWSRSHRS